MTTTIDDPSYHLKESDVDAGGHWTAGPAGTLTGHYSWNDAWTDQVGEDGQVRHSLKRDWNSQEDGNDPLTGEEKHNEAGSHLPPQSTNGDWFSDLADFAAGVADTLTGGLTQGIRQTLDLDGVNYNSGAYRVGTYVGEGLNVGLSLVNPCGKLSAVSKYFVKGKAAYDSAHQAVQAGEALAKGDILSFGLNVFGARMSAKQAGRSCFVAGTPVRTGDASIAIDALKSWEEYGDECDYVLARNEFDPQGPLELRRVLQKFVRVSPILNLHVGGKLIGTTAEHPFYVLDKGWMPAVELRIGDLLQSSDGKYLPVEGVADSGRVETVYNVEVEGDHTYFIGQVGWGWDVWTHNAEYRTRTIHSHGELSPQANRAIGHKNIKSDNFVQSHHIIQDEWAKTNIKNYSRTKAPAILLPSSSGQAHAIISANQRARALQRQVAGVPVWSSTSMRQEFSHSFQDLTAAGLSPKEVQKAMTKAYKYFSSLGAI